MLVHEYQYVINQQSNTNSMQRIKILAFFSLSLIFFSRCTSSVKEVDETTSTKDTTAIAIIQKSIHAHGMDTFSKKKISFEFRDKNYSVARMENSFVYTRSWQDDSLGFVQDSLVNSVDFSRYIDGEKASLSELWEGRYANSVNSVLYFTQLPLGLLDEAVIATYLGMAEVMGEPYHKIKVTFREEGGGEDFDDVYCYWIHSESFLLDYLGYEFQVDGGGTRFRKAINRTKNEGIVLQDYINYKSEDPSTSILAHDQLYENGNLKELSRILNENIKVENL